MGILAAYVVPHPPLIVPAVGRGEERRIQSTIDAYREVARRAAALTPDTVVLVSPHAPLFRDGFFVSDAAEEAGSMDRFGAPHEALATTGDVAFARDLARRLAERGIPVADGRAGRGELDHGSFVPLHFLAAELDLDDVRVVRLGLSGLPAADHRQVGRAIAATAADLGRRVVLVASGDWSHHLAEDGPYGFRPEGPAFDAELRAILAAGDLTRLFSLDEALCEAAGECGLRSFQIMAGALEGLPFTGELLSYEGPFGVGYGVAAFAVEDADEPGEATAGAAAGPTPVDGADPLVALARQAVEAFTRTGEIIRRPADLPPELGERRAGAFVSLHERGQLRGCIGTIEPVRRCLADEVIRNAVSACSRDPRFPPVEPDELDFLEYSVDVLGEPEPVFSLEQLDPARYGVIVSHRGRRGLLLPDLEGVDTVADQLSIAKAKAGIRPDEDAEVERFEVVRHTAGGKARRG
ncbi:AmmeMemoRadiSam system protein A [Adlercreutzia faecimuris]|uniref:AmmeMemoRadiSam system protein A n=1 Tax=Adlercreutzia faecimuris TaxID=2897341 RepID=A0ABS9WHS9_9ACTN|nr:AmmeMemoRadiSam system protein A [Adlercreutzia sp. JBNU-10]MCI2242406.1 AmmeMemoRadiSam system protein A [Adlercreutzia sp. JBNU-10]